MKLRFKFLLLVVVLIGGILISYSSTRAANCQITSVTITDQSLVIGQNSTIRIIGQDCSGQRVTATVYGRSGVGKFVIKKIALAFNTNAISISSPVVFLAPELSGRTGDTNAFIEVVTDSNSSTKDSVDFVIKSPTGCQLSNPRWSWSFSATPIIGSPLHMLVDASGCSKYNISFKIYSLEMLSDREVDTVNGTFDSAGTKIDLKWVVDTSKDTRAVSSRIGWYYFYFIASADNSKVTSNKEEIPAGSKDGCLNCNAVYGIPVVPSVMCSDGASVTGTTYSSALTACRDQNHIGDALTDKSGTCATCSGPPSVPGGGGPGGPSTPDGPDGPNIPATESKSYSFNITNPIQGGPNDLSDIIDIVTKWLLNISIPLAVIFILWAGFLMITAGPTPAKFDKGKKILVNVVIGLAVIFIGRGFITLIYSIIELGGQDTIQGSGLPPDQPDQPVGPPLAGIGDSCANNNVCQSGLICNKICQRRGGNEVGEACNKTSNPPNCKSNMCSTTGGNTNGTCVDNSPDIPSGPYVNSLSLGVGALSGGKVGQPYNLSLIVTNATDPAQVYNWKIVSGELPLGLLLDPSSMGNSGQIYGTPTKAGVYRVQLQAMDTTNKLYGRFTIPLTITASTP